MALELDEPSQCLSRRVSASRQLPKSLEVIRTEFEREASGVEPFTRVPAAGRSWNDRLEESLVPSEIRKVYLEMCLMLWSNILN